MTDPRSTGTWVANRGLGSSEALEGRNAPHSPALAFFGAPDTGLRACYTDDLDGLAFSDPRL
jgi:hypothetical protein